MTIRVYSNSCCSCSFEPEIIKISQSSHKMYSNNILNFWRVYDNFKCLSKKVWKLIEGTTYPYTCRFMWLYNISWLLILFSELNSSFLFKHVAFCKLKTNLHFIGRFMWLFEVTHIFSDVNIFIRHSGRITAKYVIKWEAKYFLFLEDIPVLE